MANSGIFGFPVFERDIPDPGLAMLQLSFGSADIRNKQNTREFGSMNAAVYPRYTLFEKVLLAMLYVIEIPFHAFAAVAVKGREHFSRLYLDETEWSGKK